VEVKHHSDTITTGTPFFKNQIPGHSIAFRWRERGQIEDIFNPSRGKKENNLLVILYTQYIYIYIYSIYIYIYIYIHNSHNNFYTDTKT